VPGRAYLKDRAGIRAPDRARTLIPAVRAGPVRPNAATGAGAGQPAKKTAAAAPPKISSRWDAARSANSAWQRRSALP
jgi:hypothetical protein